jgi:hypothetical protein
MRALGLALLLLPACGKSESKKPPAAETAEVAGDVREVSGEVTATRGEASRTLAVGDTVAADEVIATGDGAAVLIELRHNHARWSLAAGKSKKVSESAAWKAAARDPSADTPGERSTAAGRHAEREAHDTGASKARGFQPAAPTPVPAEEPGAPADSEDQAGGTGTRMALEEGKMGKKESDRQEGQYKMKATPAGPAVDDVVPALVELCGAPTAALTVTLVIDADGKVEEASADGEADCIVDGLLRIPFDKAEAGTRTITIPAAG